MMGRTSLLLPLLVLAAAVAVPSGGGAMPPVRQADDDGRRPKPTARSSLEVETRLDFDRLILLGPGEGTAGSAPTARAASRGSSATISARAMVGSAIVRGEAGRTVRIDLPARIELIAERRPNFARRYCQRPVRSAATRRPAR